MCQDDCKREKGPFTVQWCSSLLGKKRRMKIRWLVVNYRNDSVLRITKGLLSLDLPGTQFLTSFQFHIYFYCHLANFLVCCLTTSTSYLCNVIFFLILCQCLFCSAEITPRVGRSRTLIIQFLYFR